MKKKIYRRFIRIGGELITSPRFDKKSDADTWYHEQRRKKQFLRDGLTVDTGEDSIRFIDYSRGWLRKRMKSYPVATCKADEQRLRDYILPHLSELPIGSIQGPQIRNLLLQISQSGYLQEGFTISASTRDRVKALLSAIFSDALNEDPPLVAFNPVLGIKIKEKRLGKKKPRYLADSADCLKFIESAKALGWNYYVIACIFLMTGVRKQELIALKWRSFDYKNRSITVTEKYEQASNSIIRGTKAGEDSQRTIFIPSELALLLKEHQRISKYRGPDDFIICKPSGRFCGGRQISVFIERIREKAGLDISAHGLRHTFGREFAEKAGNIKALQAILGHTSSSTTDIYSEISGNRIKPFGEVVSFDLGVKQRDK